MATKRTSRSVGWSVSRTVYHRVASRRRVTAMRLRRHRVRTRSFELCECIDKKIISNSCPRMFRWRRCHSQWRTVGPPILLRVVVAAFADKTNMLRAFLGSAHPSAACAAFYLCICSTSLRNSRSSGSNKACTSHEKKSFHVLTIFFLGLAGPAFMNANMKDGTKTRHL